MFLNLSPENISKNGIPQFEGLNMDWSFNPMSVLAGLNVPQMWVLAEKDRVAPIDLTLERLSALREGGKDLEVYVFPETDHGMWEYEEAPDGSRIRTRVTPGFYDLISD